MEKEKENQGKLPDQDKIDTNKPTMFLRRGALGGLYFFSPKGTTIYYMSHRHVRDLLEGKREFAVIHKSQTKENVH